MQSRIIAVVDAYDAMISDRPYRKGLDKKQWTSYLKTRVHNLILILSRSLLIRLTIGVKWQQKDGVIKTNLEFESRRLTMDGLEKT